MDFGNIITIWKREIKGYFYTPLAYAFIGIFTLLMGFMFSSFLDTYEIYTARSSFGMAPSVTIDRLSEALYMNMHVILMFILPFFTMRLFTEESRQNTMALLMTSPIRTWELTLAKFKASATILLIMLGITVIFPVMLWMYADKTGGQGGPDWGVVATTYLGLFLSSLVYIGFGAFWSSLTESQLIAVVMAFATNFILGFGIGLWAQGSSGTVQEVLKYLSIGEQLQSFSKGILELKNAVYFASVIFLALFLTNRSLESRSWRA